MDIKIEKKKGWRALLQMKNIPYALGGVFLVFVVWLLLRDKASTLRVDADVVTVSEVEAGEFNDYVRLTGTVQPITTVQLSPLESGVVERIVAEEGSKVKKGDVIIEMSNNSLSMQILQSEADLAENRTFGAEYSYRETAVYADPLSFTPDPEQLQLDIDVERKRRDYERKERLYKNELLSQEEWLQAKEDYELALNKRQLNVEKQRQDSLFRSNQVGQMEESLHSMTLNMQLIRERVDNLKVKAPIDGEVGMLDIVLGQSVGQGTAIGQVNDLSAYKVTAQIDEHYIDRVTMGLTASFERQETRFEMLLRKVYPEVREGQFKADFVFTGDIPENIRSGQTYYLNLQLGQPTESIFIPRGSFYQSTGGSWIYVVDASGEKAHPREIRIGRQNPQYYEVVEGLDAGERVITSSYDNFGDHDVLILK